MARSTTRLRDEINTSLGVNLFGYVTSNQSQGVIARNLVATLRTQGVPVAVTDVAPTFGGTGHDESQCSTGCDDASAQPHPLTIFCFTPVDAEDFLRHHPQLLRRDRLTAVVVFVEHHLLRPEFLPLLSGVDLVLTPTDFVAGAVRSGSPKSLCVPFRQTALVPDAVTADRSRWGMPAGHVSFVFSFDTYSDSNRKNPHGLVRAFQAAFPDRDDVMLIIKVAHLAADEGLGGQAIRAVAAAADDSRITFLEQELSYSEVLGLYASADVVASLHRSEGLGLIMMEAMSLGTAVMATAYSGNLDFMTTGNSVLVDFRLIPVETAYPGYSHLQGVDVWADPEQLSAVTAMRRLADDASLRASLAARGQADTQERRDRVVGGDLLVELDRIFEAEPLWTRHRRQRARLWWCARRPQARLSLGDLRHLAAVRVKRVLCRAI